MIDVAKYEPRLAVEPKVLRLKPRQSQHITNQAAIMMIPAADEGSTTDDEIDVVKLIKLKSLYES